jgi:CHAT domain-containing protein
MFTGFLMPIVSIGESLVAFNAMYMPSDKRNGPVNDSGPESLEALNDAMLNNLRNRDAVNSKITAEKLNRRLRSAGNETSGPLSSANYLLGVYSLMQKKYSDAIRFLEVTAAYKESNKEYDERYAKTLYNLGVAYSGLGDYFSQRRYSERSLDVEKKIYGEFSSSSIQTYFNLMSACVGLQEYNAALDYSKVAMKIYSNNPGSADMSDMAGFYSNLGVIYLRLADYSKAKMYLEKSESIYNLNKLEINENYFGLLNNLAITYRSLGLNEKSTEYYRKGIDLAMTDYSETGFSYINSYAIVLGLEGNIMRGDSLLKRAMEGSRRRYGESSPVFITVLYFYAEYLREFKIDKKKSLEYFTMCLNYLKRNNSNIFLKDQLYLGYASALSDNGDYFNALDVIQSILFNDGVTENSDKAREGHFENPPIESVKADKISINILRLKYTILWNIYNKTQDLKILVAASETAKLIIGVLETVRINISEDDSRLILGDRYRNAYLNAIRDFNLLYRRTGNQDYLEEAFEYLEKSKVAGLLTATRELNASQFSIPTDLADLEKKLKSEINLLNAKIDEETKKDQPDTLMVNIWNENILRSTVMKDSLIALFEKKYPGYFALKYNTAVTKLNDIPGLIGRNGNYINYVATDTILYIFVANRKNRELLAIPADSSLFGDIRKFRSLLAMPSSSGNAREAFENFQQTGYRLYQKIIEPVRPYLISNKLIISPDNILSYIPFETIPMATSSGDRILYNHIQYLMNEFDISYTYSVTFMAESMKKDRSLRNRLVAFAPNYSEPIDIGSVLMNRQIDNGVLPDLPYARQEAEYVSDVTNGTLYENDDASEAVYKKESGKYDIIHLAMHTVLNDREPMYSTLIFSADNDTTSDRYLKTYEVYSIPLRAKMVVLSSCNSGSGYLYSGEGILSLARGFMYSGSESVVMAMWEIEDKSGTEIVKSFYDNLKMGYTKSSALRRSRISYLKKADQLRSHPYFWSSLVVYGDNSPLYYSRYFYLLTVFGLTVCSAALAFYFWRRRYS